MAKRLVVKTGTYTNNQGEEKGEYTNIGVLLNKGDGDFIILDPTVSLAGLALKQRMANPNSKGSVMVSIFEDDNNRQQAPQPQNNGGGGGGGSGADIPF